MTVRPLTEDCPTCGQVISGRFCTECGERRPSERIYTLREFAHEIFEVVTNVERSFIRTLWTLVRTPGELTAAYMRGERVRYLRPLQLFLLVNVIFFFASGPGVRVYTTPLNSHLNSSPYKEQARRMVAERRTWIGLTERQYHAAFNAKTVVLARTLVIVIAPALSLVVALLSVRRRKPAVQHLVFGLHYLAFMLAMTMVLGPTIKWIGIAWLRLGGPISEWGLDQVTGVTFSIGIATYLFFAFRRAYGDGKGAAAAKALVSVAAIIVTLTMYRMLLFYATVWALSSGDNASGV